MKLALVVQLELLRTLFVPVACLIKKAQVPYVNPVFVVISSPDANRKVVQFSYCSCFLSGLSWIEDVFPSSRTILYQAILTYLVNETSSF